MENHATPPAGKPGVSYRNEVHKLTCDVLRPLFSSSPFVPNEELLKLWKGLFFCMRLSDNNLDLPCHLSRFLLQLPRRLFPRLFFYFLYSLRCEWFDVRHRESFYFLLRFMVRSSFFFLRHYRWDPTLVRTISSDLTHISQLSSDRCPTAVHLDCCISHAFVQEMVPFFPLQPATLDALLQPLELFESRKRIQKLAERKEKKGKHKCEKLSP